MSSKLSSKKKEFPLGEVRLVQLPLPLYLGNNELTSLSKINRKHCFRENKQKNNGFVTNVNYLKLSQGQTNYLP